MGKNSKKSKKSVDGQNSILNENKTPKSESLDKNKGIYGKNIVSTSKIENNTIQKNIVSTSKIENNTMQKNIVSTSKIENTTMQRNNVDGLFLQFSLPTGQRIVDIDEYEGIIEENEHLRDKISMLEEDKKNLYSTISVMSTNERILQETEKKLQKIIEYKDITIDELIKENKELKIRLEVLELQLKESLRKNEENTKKTQRLEDQMKILMTKSQFDKFIIAIQDLNSHYRLEDTEPSVKNDLIDLRDDRVSGCHYLKRGLTQDELDYRINIFIEKLKNMDDDVQELFEDNYPGFLDNFEPLISSINKKIPEKQRKIINKWWNQINIKNIF